MTRPVCVHCGKPYGQRAVTHADVTWDTPSINTGRIGSLTAGFTQRGGLTPPPAYRGNGVVVKETRAYVSATTGKAVMTRYVWDGESYWTNTEPFCTLRCALDYARRAYARSDHRRLTMVRGA